METYEEIKNLSIEDLKKEYDKLAKTTQPGLSFYREEIARRESNRMNSDMLIITRHMRNMTIAISVMTLVNVIVVIINLLK